MYDSKVRAVLNWPQSTTVKELPRFLAFTNFYRGFIRNFSTLAAAITSMRRGKKKNFAGTLAVQIIASFLHPYCIILTPSWLQRPICGRSRDFQHRNRLCLLPKSRFLNYTHVLIFLVNSPLPNVVMMWVMWTFWLCKQLLKSGGID